MRTLHSIFAALLIVIAIDVRAEQLPIKAYTVADGLAQNSVNSIVRDKRGFLWFCTGEGLSRFDGNTFANYGMKDGLPHRVVTAFLETRTGQIWVGTHDGLTRFDPSAQPMFSPVLPPDNSPSSRSVSVLRESGDGSVWVGTANGVYRLACVQRRCSLQAMDVGMSPDHPEQREVEDLLEDRRGDLWIATAQGLYRRGRDGSVGHYTMRDGLPSDFLQCLLEDSRGQLWAGSRESGFFRIDTTEVTKPPRVAESFIYDKSGQKTTWVYQLTETPDGALWAATNRGILILRPAAGADRKLVFYGVRNGLTHYEVTAISQDNSGNMWLGTSASGAMKIVQAGFVTYGEGDGIVGVNAVFGDRDGGICFRAYLIGNEQTTVLEGAKLDPLRPGDTYWARFGRFDGERLTWLFPRAMKHSDVGWMGERVTLQGRSGEWWFGTGHALFRFPPVKFRELETARPLAVYATEQVYRLFEDSRGDVWVSTTSSDRNLLRWEHSAGVLREVAKGDGLPSPPNDLARSFGEDASGNVWIGFARSVARYRDGKFALFTTNEGLPPGGINDIHADHKGRLWLASSSSGVVRVDDPGATAPKFRSYATAQGLSSDLAEVLTEDQRGRIYIGTGRGVDEVDPDNGRIRHFSTADGLAPGRILAAYCDSHGMLWFGTTQGVSRLSSSNDGPTPAPMIVINSVSVAGSRHRISALGERNLSLPQLLPRQNQLQFEYAALNFAAGQTLTYQYRMEGSSNADWSRPTEQRTIRYADLNPGRYTFAVRPLTSDGVFGVPATVTFTILPQVWQRWWFISLIALVIVLAAYTAYSLRVRRILEVANIRNRIAADLHDDIGANLTRIAILSEVARRELSSDGEEGPLSSIARISRESVAAMSDIVWAINPERDTLVDVVRRMRRQVEEVVAGSVTTLSFSTSGVDESLKVGPGFRRDLFLIFKEAVSNAARHSRSTRLEIELRVEGSSLMMRVADDGVGFDAAAESAGQGLTSMRRRAQKMGGVLEIDSDPGHGTTVQLRVLSRERRWPLRRSSYINTRVT